MGGSLGKGRHLLLLKTWKELEEGGEEGRPCDGECSADVVGILVQRGDCDYT